MRVILIRHGRVLVDWQKRYNSAAYDAENLRYDSAPIEELERMDLGIERVYTSTLPRSAATAAFLEGPVRIDATSLLDEVPLRSFKDSEALLPTWLWNFMATLQWHIGSRRTRETRAETDTRIDAFLDRIEAAGEDCIVVGHGLHFYEMMRRMKKRGYEGRIKRYMRNGEILEFANNLGGTK
jgi:broad specificity phosphatase PhoE